MNKQSQLGLVIEPMPDSVLVELNGTFGNVPVGEKYDTVPSGKIIAVNKEDGEKYGHLVGDTGYWNLFKDDCRIIGTKPILAFIETKHILGTSHVDDTAKD